MAVEFVYILIHIRNNKNDLESIILSKSFFKDNILKIKNISNYVCPCIVRAK